MLHNIDLIYHYIKLVNSMDLRADDSATWLRRHMRDISLCGLIPLVMLVLACILTYSPHTGYTISDTEVRGEVVYHTIYYIPAALRYLNASFTMMTQFEDYHKEEVCFRTLCDVMDDYYSLTNTDIDLITSITTPVEDFATDGVWNYANTATYQPYYTNIHYPPSYVYYKDTRHSLRFEYRYIIFHTH